MFRRLLLVLIVTQLLPGSCVWLVVDDMYEHIV